MPNIWIVLIVLLLAALLIKEYLPAYAKERGKNLATREDIEDHAQGRECESGILVGIGTC